MTETTFTQEQKLRIAESVKKISDATLVLLDISFETDDDEIVNTVNQLIDGNRKLLNLAK